MNRFIAPAFTLVFIVGAGAWPRAQSSVLSADVKRDYRTVRELFHSRRRGDAQKPTTASSRLPRSEASVGRSLMSPTISAQPVRSGSTRSASGRLHGDRRHAHEEGGPDSFAQGRVRLLRRGIRRASPTRRERRR